MHHRILAPALLLALVLPLTSRAAVALPPPPPPDAQGFQLILDHEVGGGERYYRSHLARPTWPGAASGVTVGIGYDLGYNSPPVILSDWAAVPPAPRLAAVSGIRGRPAAAEAARLRDILIPWAAAEDVFARVTLARYYGLACRTYPGLDRLAPPAQWALVSLVFNRGSSLAGPRRAEMRRIRALVPRADYRAIAAEIRAMKRHWRGQGVDGLIARREAEAQLVEACD
jgi:hypothetical protein